MQKDQRKATYAAALQLWKDHWKRAPERKPSPTAFGLSDKEAADVERDGYNTSILPPGPLSA
jgi:hypothetical protein